jgi:hypothetical protein
MNPVLGFLLGFLVFILVAAIVILGLRYLIRISGITGELAQIAYLVVFLVLLVSFFFMAPWHWAWFPMSR